jgi:hypothetical protein
MLNPKEKAIELVSKMCLLDCRDENIIIAKQSAFICVDEILENNYGAKFQMIFWQEVKQEINKL